MKRRECKFKHKKVFKNPTASYNNTLKNDALDNKKSDLKKQAFYYHLKLYVILTFTHLWGLTMYPSKWPHHSGSYLLKEFNLTNFFKFFYQNEFNASLYKLN